MAPTQAVAPQVPLVDPNAEEALVGAMITSAEARAVGLTTCGAEDFNTAEHRAVFLAISSLMAAGLHVDPVTVHAQLRREPVTLDTKVDWLEYLVNLQAKTSWSAKNAATYADLVAEKARARRARAASIEFQQQLSEGVDPATAISAMFASLNEAPSHQLVGMADLVDAAVDLLEQGRPKNGIGTRIPELDEILHGGFLPKNLVIIGARPGMGKSAFALSTAVNAAELGHKVLFVSGEMSRLEIAMRIVARYSGIPSSVSMNASGPESYTPGEIAKFTEALQKMAALPIKWVEGATTISAMRARAQAEAMTGAPFELIVLDYLQIMKPEARQGSDRGRQNDVSDIARGAKELAMDLNSVVIALSQLSRKLEDRSDKRPMLADLRDCLTGDTRILDASTGRLIRMDEACANGAELTVLTLDGGLRLHEATASQVWAAGEKDVFRLRTRSGREIRASANHPFLTIDGWKRLDEIVPGTEIGVPRTYRVQAVSKLHPELARLLGYLVSDGHYGRRRTPQITSRDPEVLEDAAVIVRKHFGFEPRIRSHHRSSAQMLEMAVPGGYSPGRNPLTNWLKEIGIHGDLGPSKRLPDVVMTGDESVVVEALAGLWAGDGTVTPSTQRNGGRFWALKYVSTSRELLHQVQHLLLRLGILSTITPERMDAASVYPLGEVVISGREQVARFAELVPVPFRKGALLEPLKTWATVGASTSMLDRMPLAVNERILELKAAAGLSHVGLGYRVQGKRISRAGLELVAERTGAADLARLAGSDLLWDTVVEITPDGREMTYDVEVPDGHSFVANDILVHNSGELEQAADTVIALYRDEVYEPATQDAGVIELIVLKQRNGQSGVTARAAWHGERTTVLPLARGYGHATVVSKSGSTPGPMAPRGQAPEDSWGAEEEGAEGADAGEGVGQIF